MSRVTESKRDRRRKKHKQAHINVQLKKNLFGHLFIAPCYYCKKVFFIDVLTIEHVTPLCLGGTNDPANIALACHPCNHEKGKEAWHQKCERNKRYHEQHPSQHRSQSGQESLQDS